MTSGPSGLRQPATGTRLGMLGKPVFAVCAVRGLSAHGCSGKALSPHGRRDDADQTLIEHGEPLFITGGQKPRITRFSIPR